MSIKVEWDNDEKSVMRYTVEGAWTWDEFYEARDQASGLIEESPYASIGAIIDFRAGNFMPRNALSHFHQVSRTSNPRSGLAVMVGASGFVTALFHLMSRVYGSVEDKMRLAEDMDEARAILAQTRSETILL
jgi:hypothetical protein